VAVPIRNVPEELEIEPFRAIFCHVRSRSPAVKPHSFGCSPKAKGDWVVEVDNRISALKARLHRAAIVAID